MKNKGKKIQKILDPYMKKHNFIYNGGEPNIWYYSRKVGNIEQNICIQESRFAQELKLYFETRTNGFSSLSAEDLIPEEELQLYNCADIVARYEQKNHMKPGRGWWGYITEEDFCECLEMFGKIIEKYGLKALDGLSRQEEYVPTVEMADFLFQQHVKLHDQFVEKYSVQAGSMSLDTINDWFQQIERLIQENASQEYEQAKPLLLEIAAFLGDEMVDYAGGKWEHPQGNCEIYISELECYMWSKFNVLQMVVEMWVLKTIVKCKEMYEFIYTCKLPLTPEEMVEILKDKMIKRS